MEEDSKIFGWFEGRHSGTGELIRRLGPYYDHDAKVIGGRAFYHTLAELRKCTHWSASKLSRLEKCRPGTRIKMHHIHSTGSMFLKRLSDEETKDFQDLASAQEALRSVQEKIRNAVPELHQERERLAEEILRLKQKHSL